MNKVLLFVIPVLFISLFPLFILAEENNTEIISINIVQNDDKLEVGTGKGLKFEYLFVGSPPKDSQSEFIWYTSNSKIVTVKDGFIKVKNTGIATITCCSKKNPNIKDTCTIVGYISPTKWIDTKECYTYINKYRKSNKGLLKESKARYKSELKKAKKIKTKSKRQKAIKKAKNRYKYKTNIKLSRSPKLEKLAKIRVKEMAKTGKFSHTRPNGKKGLSLIKGNLYKGENIAMGQKTCKEVSIAFYNSKSHKTNILKKQYRKVGIAAYKYRGITYWCQLFSS